MNQTRGQVILTEDEIIAELERAIASGHPDWVLDGAEAKYKDSEYRVVFHRSQWWAIDVEGYEKQALPSPEQAMKFWEQALEPVGILKEA